MKGCMKADDVHEVMSLVNGDTEDESDDIISDAKFFDYFCRVVRNLDDLSLNETNIEKTVKNVLRDAQIKDSEKLKYALLIMVYAYISGKCLEQINYNKKELKKFKEV